MGEEPSGENANDAVASALSDLATTVTGLDDWHQIRDWALKGAADNQIPPQLSGLDSYRAVSTALAADEHLAVLVNEASPQRPVVRVGLFGMQLRASALPAGMIASAIVRCCLREPYTGRPTPAVLRDAVAENLNVLRRIAVRKTVTLSCLAGARGVRLRPGQASLETVLGTLHSKDAFHVPELTMAGNPDVLITTTVRTPVQVLQQSDSKWGTDDPAAEAAKQRLSHLRLALLLGSAKAVAADVPDWTRTTITGFALLMPFIARGWDLQSDGILRSWHVVSVSRLGGTFRDLARNGPMSGSLVSSNVAVSTARTRLTSQMSSEGDAGFRWTWQQTGSQHAFTKGVWIGRY